MEYRHLFYFIVNTLTADDISSHRIGIVYTDYSRCNPEVLIDFKWKRTFALFGTWRGILCVHIADHNVANLQIFSQADEVIEFVHEPRTESGI